LAPLATRGGGLRSWNAVPASLLTLPGFSLRSRGHSGRPHLFLTPVPALLGCKSAESQNLESCASCTKEALRHLHVLRAGEGRAAWWFRARQRAQRAMGLLPSGPGSEQGPREIQLPEPPKDPEVRRSRWGLCSRDSSPAPGRSGSSAPSSSAPGDHVIWSGHPERRGVECSKKAVWRGRDLLKDSLGFSYS
jgi:hypothetical protein